MSVDVVDEHRVVVEPLGRSGAASTEFVPIGLAADRHQLELLAVELQDGRGVGIAQSGCLLDDPIEDRPEVAGMGADQLKDPRCRGLEVERLAEFRVAPFDLREEPGVVDGDGGLVGEGLEQREFGVGVAARGRPGEGRYADHVAVSPHRECEQRAQSAEPGSRVRVLVGRQRFPVTDVEHLAGSVHRRGRRGLVAVGPHEALGSLVQRLVAARPGHRACRDAGVVEHGDGGVGVVAQPPGVVHDPVEHRLGVETGIADCLEHVGHRGLPLQGGIEVVEQLCVADCQRRLRGERPQALQLDLVERLDLVAEHVQPTDALIAAHQGSDRVAVDVARSRHVGVVGGPTVGDGHEVVDEDDALAERTELFGRQAVGRLEQRAEVRLHGGPVRRHESFRTALDERDRARFTAAEFRRLVQDPLQDRVALARVLADQPQHFGGCCLQLQRLGEFGIALLDVREQACVRDGVAGLGGERLQQFDLVGGERLDGESECRNADRWSLAPHRREHR